MRAFRRSLPRLDRPAIVRLCVFVPLAAWAGFWTWFVVLSASSDGLTGWLHGLPILAGVLGLPVIAWFWPRAGGLLLAGAGVFAAWYFRHQAAQLMLALPAFVLGLVLASGLCSRLRSPKPIGT